MVCDVTDEEQVKASVKDCVTKFGGIDVVDSNAGYLDQWKKIGESDTTSWWKTWEVNLKGTYYVIRYTTPYLIESARRMCCNLAVEPKVGVDDRIFSSS